MNVKTKITLIAAFAVLGCTASQAADKYPENDQLSYLCKYTMSFIEDTEETNTTLPKFCNDEDFEEPNKK